MVGGLLLLGDRTDTIDSAFFYGRTQVRKHLLLVFCLFLSNCTSFIWFSSPQIISTAVVLSVSLALGAVSLMGLSQGDREQRGYQALSRAAVTGASDELRAPGGQDEQQQPHAGSSAAGSINTGSGFQSYETVCRFIKANDIEKD